jgi:hypothetical protein
MAVFVCGWLAWIVLCLGLSLVPGPVLFAVAMFGGIPILCAWIALSVWSFAKMIRSLADEEWLLAVTFLAIPFAVPIGVYHATHTFNIREIALAFSRRARNTKRP